MNLNSITFLIGGKLSNSWDNYFPGWSRMRMGDPVVSWYKPFENSKWVKNFYRLASQEWGDIYGDNKYGTVGYPDEFGRSEKFFFWEGTATPSLAVTTKAAEKLIERVEWIKQNHSDGRLKIRLVGHSAGCLVANRVTQLISGQGYGNVELLLCAPPVPNNSEKFGLFWGKDDIPFAFPNLQEVSRDEFLYIPVKNDNVLNGHGVGTRYDSEFVKCDYPIIMSGSIAPPDNLIRSRKHWHPVRYSNWKRHYSDWYRSQGRS